MASIFIDNSVHLELKSDAGKEITCSLMVAVVTGESFLVTGLVPIPPRADTTLPDEASVIIAARKLRRRLIGNVFIAGVLYSSSDDAKSSMSHFQTLLTSLRSMIDTNSKNVAKFYNRKSLADNCCLLAVYNKAKNSLSCRMFPEMRTVEHTFCDLSSRGFWIKAVCRICVNTSSVSCVSVEEKESMHDVQKILNDILMSILGDLSKKTAIFHLNGQNISITGHDNGLISQMFPDGSCVAEVELRCQPFVRGKSSIYTEEAEYFRMAVAGDIEAAVCLHSKHSKQSDLYDGLISDLVFTLADLLSSSLKSFQKDVSENSEEFALLALPRRLLPSVSLPEKQKNDLLSWSLATYEQDTSSDLEYIFHRDKVMNELNANAGNIRSVDRAVTKKSAHDVVSLENLSCSTSYGAAMFFLGGFVLVILAIFVQSFLPDIIE